MLSCVALRSHVWARKGVTSISGRWKLLLHWRRTQNDILRCNPTLNRTTTGRNNSIERFYMAIINNCGLQRMNRLLWLMLWYAKFCSINLNCSFHVNISIPVSVTSNVCSNWAERFPSVVVAVHWSGLRKRKSSLSYKCWVAYRLCVHKIYSLTIGPPCVCLHKSLARWWSSDQAWGHQ